MDVGFLLAVDSNHVEARPGPVPVLEASAPAQARPTADPAEHQRRQPDTAEGGRLAEREGVADWACHWIDHCYEVDQVGP